MSLLIDLQAAPTTVGAAVHVPTDTVIVESPLPGGIATVVRWIFGVPRWVMISGIVIGTILGALLLVWLWRHRAPLLQWLSSRTRRVQVTLGLSALALVLAAAGTGRASWNYMQHDNGFCTGCHVMEDPFKRFVVGAGKHDSLSCHDCHNQSIFASASQLYMWIAERPDKINKHADVPIATCAACHVTGTGKEKWQQIASTAGHRVHLESDSTALAGVQCVTCHGLEVHRFVPVDSTCGQSGCHDVKQIRLGRMALQTSLHCATCHQFTLDVPALATRDSAAGTLVPNSRQCLGCHEMQQVLADFDPAFDPHSGTCGMCHNPHTQSQPSDAKATCTNLGCHANWRSEPFHTGPNHRSVQNNCTTCHIPHRAKVDASNCASCHRSVAERSELRPPLPFDTTRALRGGGDAEPPSPPMLGPAGKGDEAPIAPRPRAPPPPVHAAGRTDPLAVQDSFPHPPHLKLACLTCHASELQHGRLTFAPPRGCQICHHSVPQEKRCETCHQATTLAASMPRTIQVTVREHAPRPRTVAFSHATHIRERRCVECHTTPVTMAPASGTLSCTSCHENHHAARRDCATCHTTDVIKQAHTGSRDPHTRCDECHTSTTVARLVPTRSFCLACHVEKRRTADREAHYPAKECTTCHFLAPPEAVRGQLTGGAGAGRP